MATRTDRTGPPRPPLSRERVLRAGIELADEGGIEALSMRTLAQSLGVGAMSLYHHVAGKDALLDAMVDVVIAEFELPAEGADWKTAIRRSAISAHDALMRHRWASGLMMSASSVHPGRLRYMEALLRRLREGGLSAEMTHHAYHALDSHIVGFTLWLVGISLNASQLADLGSKFLQTLPVDEYPYLAEHIQQHITPSTQEGKTEFQFGLDLILDGLERMRDEA